MTDKYRINSDFVMPPLSAAKFFAFFTEREYRTGKWHPTLDRWRDEGVTQTRVTIVNDEYPNPPYPHGVWFEGWTDRLANMLPFGEAETAGGAVYPPLTVTPASRIEARSAETENTGSARKGESLTAEGGDAQPQPGTP